jgi:hypothetical protein
MQAGDEAFQRLQRAIDEVAAVDASELVAEARIEARAKVRAMLTEAMAQAMLARAHDELGNAPAGAPAPRSAPPPPPAPPARPADRPPGSTEPRAPAPRGTADPPPAAARPQAPTELGWYVYCVIDPEGIDLAPHPLGVDAEHPVAVLHQDGIAAVASQVALDEFGEETLRESLNDLAWLEDKARRHEAVLAHVRDRATVIPMRLCTIYRSEAAVREMLAREHGPMAEALARLAAKTEWGVKLFAIPAELEQLARRRSPRVADLTAQIERASAGEAYLLRKRLEALGREEGERLIEECCDGAHARLSGAAVEALLNPLQAPEIASHSGEMVLNGVYLVEDAASDRFHAAVDAVRAEWGAAGFDVQVTGPWPPYNFVKASIEAAR